MKYTKGLKIQLIENHVVQTPIYPDEDIDIWDIGLTKGGLLTLRKGFASDGASGPTFNTKSSMAPSVEHDAFYKLMRKGLLGLSWRPAVDKFLYKRLIQKTKTKPGMLKCRAKLWLRSVRRWAGYAATKKRKIYKC